MMRGTDAVGILIAVVLIVTGLFAVVRPTQVINAHLTWGPGYPMDSGQKPRALLEDVTPRAAQLYGGAAVLFGTSLGVLIIYSLRSRKA
jgi:hypothetical protein